MSESKTALITGASKGLGLEVAKQLSAKGCKIILTGRSQNALEIAREQLTNPSKHTVFCGNLLNQDLTRTLCKLPFLPDIIVHSLGGKITEDKQPLNNDVLMESIALNLSVAINLNSHYFPLMQKSRCGRIIHISSDSSETGCGAPGYVAAKAATNAYVKSAAQFYAQFNMMICAVLPGIFSHADSVWDKKSEAEPDVYQKQLQQMPMGRFLRVDEIAEIVSDIAVSESMAYSGSLIQLTGGF